MARLRADTRRVARLRSLDYLPVRHRIEAAVRAGFVAKGGRPHRRTPHDLTLGACPWLGDWYPAGQALAIPLATCRPDAVSFTYGDSCPTMRVHDGQPYRQ